MVRGDKPIFIPVLFATPFHEGDKPGDSPIDYFNGFAVFGAPIAASSKILADKVGFIYDKLTEDALDVGFFLRRNIGSTRYVILHVFPYRQLGFLADDWAWIACLKGFEGKAMSAAEATIDWDAWRKSSKKEIEEK